MLRFLVVALLVTLPPLTAQIVDADNCVYKAGDNPEWARPDFDDRQWSRDFPAIGNPYIWTRCRLDLKSLPRTGPIHVGVQTPLPWELFVDGEAAGSFGDLRNGFGPGIGRQHRALPPGALRRETVTVALRLVSGRNVFDFPEPPGITAGLKDSLLLSYSDEIFAAWKERWQVWIGAAFNTTIGIALLVLFLSSGSLKGRELLWFGLFALGFGLEDCLLIARILDLPYWPEVSIYMLCHVMAIWAGPRIFFVMAGRPLPLALSGLTAAIAASYLIPLAVLVFAPLEVALRMPRGELFRWQAVFILFWSLTPVAAFWPLSQAPKQLRLFRNLSLIWVAGEFGLWIPQVFAPNEWRGVGEAIYEATVVPVLLGMFVVIARRHRQVSLDRAELQGEMKSAQEVQRLLTSSALDVAPWAAVDVAYLPAKEVGGDFYFCRQTEEGQMIVVGDVSGKGLRAAMLASAALGSLRSFDTTSPARLLHGLNNALHGQTGGGFVTCCAVLLRDDGHLIAANAGHPSPYVDGRELAVEAGLPLGIVADVTYEESVGQGSLVTLVSDGVVEAESAKRELFGFDRTRDISTQPAAEIAQAAQAWGQTDDITVVTVRRVG